ncbi:uncharacterized protein LOC122869756 isoform X2 [Siniperca chuatsi]|uniref:uncharacterized protein LOC122869756 isoform X2 n=1 Tax=Siniperca chuatsi TaxID=119488 RepID=UPI001CE19C4F|nr:uncharacterized protein LOC122869756 isoform X2 [Siniperca chuatsi]
MEHDYSLPVAARSVAEAVPVKRKRTGEPNDPRRLWDRKRGKTRVNIGVVFPRWRGLRDKLGLRKDADLACVLLETYQKGGPSTSTSSKRPGLPVETLSTMAPSCDSPSDSGSLDSATVPRILNGTGSRTRAGLVGKRYLNSVHDESTIGPAEDANDLQNAVIDSKDPDDDDTWETASEDSSSDEDCIPSICLSLCVSPCHRSCQFHNSLYSDETPSCRGLSAVVSAGAEPELSVCVFNTTTSPVHKPAPYRKCFPGLVGKSWTGLRRALTSSPSVCVRPL